MRVGSFDCSRPPATRTLFLASAGWLVDPRVAHRLKRARAVLCDISLAICERSSDCARCLRTARARARPPRRSSGRWYRGSRRRRPARSGATARPAVARVALADIAQKTVHCNRDSFFDQLLIAPRAPAPRRLAVRNTLSAASGNTTVPMSRPSATRPGGRRNARWRSSSAARTAGWTATREAAAPTRLRRGCASVTSSPVEQDRARRRSATSSCAASAGERALVVERRCPARSAAAPPAGRARRCRGSGSRAPRRPPAATVPLPEADGPSMAMTGTRVALMRASLATIRANTSK